MNDEQRLRALYAAFNARDADAVLNGMAEDVDWPNAWEGGRVRGREAVRDYWARQWAEIDPHVAPTRIEARPDGRVAVAVDQTVKGLDGTLIGEGRTTHVYTLEDDLITRMDVEAP